jgi:hypothetical protein
VEDELEEVYKCKEVKLRCEDIKTEVTCESIGSAKGKDCAWIVYGTDGGKCEEVKAYKYMGSKEDNPRAVSTLKECITREADVLSRMTCYVISDGYETEDEEITFLMDVDYNITSSINCLSVTLNLTLINVMGTCNFISLEVCFSFCLFIFIFKQLNLINKSIFVVSGEISILDCIWNVSKVGNEECVHFNLDGGKMKCTNMVVVSFEDTKMRFLSYTGNKNMYIDCKKLMFERFEGNSSQKHFTLFGGESNFTDTVLFILIDYKNHFYFLGI